MKNIGLSRPMRTLVTALFTMSGLAVGAAVAWADPIGTPTTTAPVMAPVEVTPAVATATAQTVAAASVLTAAQVQSRQIALARTSAGARIVARAIIAQKYQWSRAQFTCLDSLWTRESNWRYRANNKSSGAYGIPQAYPGSRMAKIAPDWRTNPVTQIKWGLYYINARYGTPCNAWAKFKTDRWY